MDFLRRTLPLLAALVFIPGLVLAQETEVVAVSGTPAPDGNGTIASFITDPTDPANPFDNQSGPVLNDAGQIAFVAYLTDTEGGPGTPSDDSGLFFFDGDELVQLVREGAAPPDGDGAFTLFKPIWPPALNGNGQGAFSHALLESASGEYFEWGVYTIDEPGQSLAQVLRQGDPSPDGDGVIQFVSTPSLSDSGWMGFMGEFEHETDPLGKRGIFRANLNTEEVEVVAREYDDLPNNSSESFNLLSGGDVNESGQLVFASTFHTENPYGGQGIFLAEEGGSVQQIVRTGDPAPDSDEVVSSLFSGSRNPINDAGQVAYGAVYANCENCPASSAGILLYDQGTTKPIARTGQPSGNGGLFTGFGVDGTNTVAPALNEAGQLAFAGSFVRNDTLFRGLFRSDGEETVEIVNNGTPALDGNGYFNLACYSAPAFDCNDTPKMNEAGQVAFFTNIRTPDIEVNEGIYFHDDDIGLMKVARKGDELLGSTIAQLRFTYRGSQAHDNARSGLNNQGQVAYVFELADGRSGVAVWTCPPEVAPTATGPTTGVPEVLAIEAAYPNPFREAATLRVALPTAEAVDLAVYDVLGRRVLRRELGRMTAGTHHVEIGGGSLAPGLYVARVTMASGVATTVRLVKAE